MNINTASRREFLKLAGVTGGGLVIGVSLTACSKPESPLAQIAGAFTPNSFLQITAENKIRFYCPRDEMGQGVYMGLTTLVAEELDIHPAKIDVRFAGVHQDYNNPAIGLQTTGGSTSIRAHYYPLRQAAANARAALLQAAASKLGAAPTDLQLSDGSVEFNGQRYPYGDFVQLAAELDLPEDAPLKPKSEFKYIGAQLPRIDAVAKSTGTAVYGIDIEVPNLHRAVVIRCPVNGGQLKSFDSGGADALPGVTKIVPIFSGIAVVAESYWQAKKAAQSVQVEWDMPELAKFSSADIRRDYTELLESEEGDVAEQSGEGAAALAAAPIRVSGQYWAPYLAHATLEPMNAIVRIENGVCDVWAGNQSPAACQGIAAHFAGIDRAKVNVHNLFVGGGFGRRAYLSYVAEAAELAAITGLPVQVIWSREDDIQHGFFRPAALINIEAGMNDAGQVETWSVKRVGANVLPNTVEESLLGLLPAFVPERVANWMGKTSYSVFDGILLDSASVEGLWEDYDWPNTEIRHITKNHGIRVGYWRSVGHSFTAFAIESMLDELAYKAGKDPVELRLAHSGNNPRLHKVIKVAGDVMRKGPSAADRHLGIAAHTSFKSYVAQLAEVSVEGARIKVHKVTCVIDCGQVVNPDIVRDQMAGAIIFGLTAALHGDIEIVDGAIKQSNFHDYPILRMNESPQIEVIIVDSDADPTGAGEPGVPPIAPAVANAVFAATGQRLRSLPLKLA